MDCLLETEISEFVGFGESPNTILGDETMPKFSIFTTKTHLLVSSVYQNRIALWERESERGNS